MKRKRKAEILTGRRSTVNHRVKGSHGARSVIKWESEQSLVRYSVGLLE
jgi:hypothetical protein